MVRHNARRMPAPRQQPTRNGNQRGNRCFHPGGCAGSCRFHGALERSLITDYAVKSCPETGCATATLRTRSFAATTIRPWRLPRRSNDVWRLMLVRIFGSVRWRFWRERKSTSFEFRPTARAGRRTRLLASLSVLGRPRDQPSKTVTVYPQSQCGNRAARLRRTNCPPHDSWTPHPEQGSPRICKYFGPRPAVLPIGRLRPAPLDAKIRHCQTLLDRPTVAADTRANPLL